MLAIWQLNSKIKMKVTKLIIYALLMVLSLPIIIVLAFVSGMMSRDYLGHYMQQLAYLTQ